MSRDYINAFNYDDVMLSIDSVSQKIEKAVREIKADKLNSSIEAVRIGGMRSCLDLIWEQLEQCIKFRVLKKHIMEDDKDL